jgi:iron-sulfur cluster repair protein YtfE (RIC family)
MPTNAIDFLTTEHREADKKLAQLAQQPDQALLDETAMELRVHLEIEEEVLYPFIRDEVPEGESLMDEAESEHDEARQALQKVTQAELGSPEFTAALAELTAGVRHHVQEEETQVFPKLRETVTQARLEEFGAELEQAHEQKVSGSGSSTEGKTRDELYAEAKEIGIEGRSKMNKDELAEAVEESS